MFNGRGSRCSAVPAVEDCSLERLEVEQQYFREVRALQLFTHVSRICQVAECVGLLLERVRVFPLCSFAGVEG